LILVSHEREMAPSTVTPAFAALRRGKQRRGFKAALVALAASLRRRPDRKDKKVIVKIIDFGLAETLNIPADPMSLSRGGFVGTPAFASPEQFEHSALDVRSDIYSLGVTLWFALTGKTPFGGRSVEEIRRAQQSNALAIKQLKAMHVPSRMRSLLKSMLALEPAARPGTQELAVRLRHCSAQASALRPARVALATAVSAILR